MSNMYMDQASGLRKMRQNNRVKVIAVSGGKGGVGKTNVTLNVAGAMAAQGKRVMVLDADLGLANVDVMLGLRVHRNLSHVLAGECTIDVYGPEDDYAGAEIDARGGGRVRYGGLLTHEEVDARLWHYDCLVLPTSHPSEGYPAVIAEAFAHGIPVIATRWLAIPEIVDESCGILVEPDDTAAFVAAIAALHDDPAGWRRLRSGARARARRLAHATWARVFEDTCRRVLRD